MNKRARLTRRILREHRRGELWHWKKMRPGLWGIWYCTHCVSLHPDIKVRDLL